MKTFPKTIVFITLLFLSSCSKDNDNSQTQVYDEENSLQGYLIASGFNEQTIAITPIVGVPEYESGLKFKPLVNGKIKALVVKNPFPQVIRVTIWNGATEQVILSETIDANAANTEFTKQISPLQLDKNKTYVISQKCYGGYQRTRSDLSNTTYPITSGNIQIIDYRTGDGTVTPTYPTFAPYNAYMGDCSFQFQRTE